MMTILCLVDFLTVLILFCTPFIHSSKLQDEDIKRPIIGILAQELTPTMKSIYGADKYESFIVASYVKFVESAGAQVIPIHINKPKSYYSQVFQLLNGAVFPGGSTSLVNSGMSRAAEKIFRKAKEVNSMGDKFPILGICLGMQLLMFLENDMKDFRTNCSSLDTPLPLVFNTDPKRSRLYGNLSEEQQSLLESNKVSYNNHKYCFEQKDFIGLPAGKRYNPLTVNKDKNGLIFISSMEAIKDPFYAVQYHPEKNDFEWSVRKKGLVHSFEANVLSQYLSSFFIQESRHSRHRFADPRDELKYTIYNWSPVYTARDGLTYSQVYFFPKDRKSTI